MSQNLIDVVEPAVVKVICSDIKFQGTGFLIDSKGYIVTNNHVVGKLTFQNGVLSVEYSNNICVEIKGSKYSASLVMNSSGDRSFVYDYAILKVEGHSNFPFLELGDPSFVKRGDRVICLGYPLDFETMIATDGIVSALIQRPSHRNAIFQMRTIVSNALLQFGNSGGPMLHIESGKVIGINTLHHELQDNLRQRLISWSSHPMSADFSLLRDLIQFCLKYIHVGLNHAISIEHVLSDPFFPIETRRRL